MTISQQPIKIRREEIWKGILKSGLKLEYKSNMKILLKRIAKKPTYTIDIDR